jgi:hypothetical protein
MAWMQGVGLDKSGQRGRKNDGVGVGHRRKPRAVQVWEVAVSIGRYSKRAGFRDVEARVCGQSSHIVHLGQVLGEHASERSGREQDTNVFVHIVENVARKCNGRKVALAKLGNVIVAQMVAELLPVLLHPPLDLVLANVQPVRQMRKVENLGVGANDEVDEGERDRQEPTQLILRCLGVYQVRLATVVLVVGNMVDKVLAEGCIVTSVRRE